MRPEGEGARPEIQSANEGAAGVGPTTGVSDGPSAPVTVGAMESDSAMRKLDLRPARFGRTWRPLPHDLVLAARETDDPHSSDMDISDDDHQIPSGAGSCLQTHPPPHQQARDFLLELMREGVLLGGPSVGVGIIKGIGSF